MFIHDRLILQLSKELQEVNIPEWMMKRNYPDSVEPRKKCPHPTTDNVFTYNVENLDHIDKRINLLLTYMSRTFSGRTKKDAAMK